jgi:hypothetical protein
VAQWVEESIESILTNCEWVDPAASQPVLSAVGMRDRLYRHWSHRIDKIAEGDEMRMRENIDRAGGRVLTKDQADLHAWMQTLLREHRPLDWASVPASQEEKVDVS